MITISDESVGREQVASSRLDALYRAHATRAKRTAFLLTGDAALAEDLMHEAFVRVAGRFADLRNPEVFPAYLRRTIVHLARSRHRAEVREEARLRRHAAAPAFTDPDLASGIAVRDALMALGERQRAAVVLRYFEDLSEADIAEALGCRPGTVKSLLSRGLDALRAELSR